MEIDEKVVVDDKLKIKVELDINNSIIFNSILKLFIKYPVLCIIIIGIIINIFVMVNDIGVHWKIVLVLPIFVISFMLIACVYGCYDSIEKIYIKDNKRYITFNRTSDIIIDSIRTFLSMCIFDLIFILVCFIPLYTIHLFFNIIQYNFNILIVLWFFLSIYITSIIIYYLNKK